MIRLSLLIALLALALPASAEATFQPLGRLSPSEQGARTPQVGVDQNGNAVYVWAHYDGTDPDGTDTSPTCCWRIESRTRTAAGVLGPVQALSAAGKNAAQPQIAVAPNGNAYFTWVILSGPNPADGGTVQARTRSAAGVLSATQTLSAASQNASEPQVAVDPNGNAVFTWERFDGTTGCGGSPGCLRVQVRRRSSAGTLSTTQTLSNTGQIAYGSQLGLDSAGNAVVVWTAFTGTKNDIQLRTRAAGGALGTLQTLSGSKDSSQAQIGVRPSNGDAVLTWIEGGTSDVVVGRARSSTGTLSSIQTLSTGQFSEEPQVAVASNGNAIFTWERFDGSTGSCCWRIETRTRTQAGTLGTTEIHSAAGQTSLAPQVGFDSTGNALLVWGRSDGTSTNCCSLIQTRRRSSTGTLSSVQTLSDAGRNATEPQIAVDPNGNAVYAWTRSDGMYNRVQARRRASGGALSTVKTLSSVGPAGTAAQVAVDPNGNAVFAWMAFDGVHDSIQVRSSSSSGVLSPVQTLSDSSTNSFQPQVGVDAAGNAIFVWRRFDGTNNRVEARTRSSAGTLGPVEMLSPAAQESPQVAVDPNGNAVFAWMRSDGTNIRIEAIARSSAGTLSPVQAISPAGQNASEPQVGIDSLGNAVFVWTRFDGTSGTCCDRIEAVARSSAGTLSAVQVVSPAGQNASQPQIGVDPNGNAVFTWTRFDGTNTRIQARARAAAGTLSTINTLSIAGQNASQPQVAVNASGNAVFTWSRFDGTTFRVQGVARSSAGTLSTVQNLSGTGSNAGVPQVGIDSAGNAVFVWRFDGADKRIQARTRSSTGTLGVLDPVSNATQDADLPQVAVNATGKAFAVWQRFDGKRSRVEGAVGP